MRYLQVLTLLAILTLLSACDTVTLTSAPPLPTATAQAEQATLEVTATTETLPTATAEPLAALVNGEPIPLAEYEQQVARYEASMVAAGEDPQTLSGQESLAQGRRWVLDLMIEQKLIEQQAAKEGIAVADSDVDATIESLRNDIGEEAFNDWLAREEMTLEEMWDRLRADMLATEMANRVAEAVPTQAEHVHARHIVVGSEEEARRILSQLQAGGDFAALARTHSQDISTRDLGGDLGFFPPGVLTSREVETAAFSLQPGQLSDVIESELGYHIVQVVERVTDQEISPENQRLLRDQAVREWLDELRTSADIQVFATSES